MSTSCHIPNKSLIRSADTAIKPDTKNSTAKAPRVGVSRPLSRSNPCDGSSVAPHIPVSDDDLITAAQSGDHPAFVELCRRYSSMTKRKIVRIVRNLEDAEDVLQDTLLRAYMYLPSFRRSCKFSTWISSIGVNSALMILRKRRIRKEAPTGVNTSGAESPEVWDPADHSPGPESLYQKQQTILLVRREVEKLRPSLRSIVDLYYGRENSVEELAVALNISLGAAKSRLMRGRVTLRSKLARYGISNSGT